MQLRSQYRPQPGDRLVWDSLHRGTYKQPDNLRRIRKQAIKDFGIRQVKRAIQRQRRLQQESSNA